MQNISAVSCIEFKEADDNATAYVNITVGGTSCYSYIGYGNSVRKYNLRRDSIGSGCFRLGTIIHEFLHTLGFQHQHSSPNRNDYVEIRFDNIKNGTEGNFELLNATEYTDFGVEYDYGSVMHYSAYAFSKNGNKTIIPRQDEKIEIGQRRGLSERDIEKLNLMYKCNE